MTPSSYMWDVSVFINFGAGFLETGGSPTDVSAWVELGEGVTIAGGRQDEFSTAETNTCTLVLDNTDGRFTPGRAASPYYPGVLVGRRITVYAAEPGGGTTRLRFAGFIDEWPVEWPGSDVSSLVKITASGTLARLAEGRRLRSVVEEEYGRDDPAVLYTLSEAQGASAVADSSDYAAAPLVARGGTVTFGSATGPGTDDLTGASLPVSAKNPGIRLWGQWTGGAPASMTLEGWFSLPPGDTTPVLTLVKLRGTNASDYVSITVDGTGDVTGTASNTSGSVSATTTGAGLFDGAVHHVALVLGASVTVYVDGASAASAGAPTMPAVLTEMQIGPLVASAGTVQAGVAHVAVFGTALSAARVGEHYQAGADGFEGELTGDRMSRYLAYAGVVSSITGGAVSMLHVDTSGQSVVDMLRVVETTEGGVVAEMKTGAMTLYGRSRRYNDSATVTLSATAQEIGADYTAKLDRSALVNQVDAASSDGTVRALVVDKASGTRYGYSSSSTELATGDPNEPFQRASWLVHNWAEPAMRTPALTVDLLASPAAALILLGRTDFLGSRIDVSGLPSQAPSATAAYFIEGYTESIGPESYSMTLNVSPASPWLGMWNLETVGYTELGTSTRLAY